MELADQLADKFEANRTQLRAVAYRMLGSLSEAEDAVQGAWFRLNRSDVSEVANLAGWLTTVVSRIDAIGLAMLVVLDTLAPAERLAFVLHDMFGVSFDEIAEIVDKSPAATRQLASRARRRVQGAPTSDRDPGRHREVVDAFIAASRSGDFEALLALLDPDVVLRADAGTTDESVTGPARTKLVRGALAVVEQALTFTKIAPCTQAALINGTPGIITVVNGRLMGVMHLTITAGKITQMNILADHARLATLPA